MLKTHLKEVEAFIRERRGNERSFEELYEKLKSEIENADAPQTYRTALEDAEKKASEYKKAGETGGTAWPEFEKFVSEFEKSVAEAIKEAP